jgi:uncharacterized protein YndB with AHSA1/START domain
VRWQRRKDPVQGRLSQDVGNVPVGSSSAPYVERNVFHTVERPHHLIYASTTEWPDGSHVESLMEISLQWLDGRTLLTLTQRGVPSGDVERGFIEGWNEFLDGLVARIQTRPAT